MHKNKLPLQNGHRNPHVFYARWKLLFAYDLFTSFPAIWKNLNIISKGIRGAYIYTEQKLNRVINGKRAEVQKKRQ